MLGALAKKFFGSPNDRRVRPYKARVAQVAALEAGLQALDDAALAARTEGFRAELAAGRSLDDILVPAFAVVREAARRVLGQRHYDVQLLGGMVLNDGGIAEMRTGEGKTLVASLPAYLRALEGKGVHVVTVNDYLAARDAEAMAPLFRFLGMEVGVVVAGMEDDARRAAYACDVTYATNVELGFDYLRDNLKFQVSDMVQRGHAYALVDEVDSILIDEVRTPLIISGPSEARSDLYRAVDAVVAKLGPADRSVDEKHRTADLTEAGNERVEGLLREAGLMAAGSLYDGANGTLLHHVVQALRAHALFQRDRNYIVAGGEVVIVDESTGRTMAGRRYADGLHQAIEAKEGVEIKPETQTLASISYQNYFRLYETLSGMTGTASTEADEMREIYGLVVTEVPTNRPVARVDEDDEVYATVDGKYAAVVREVGRAHARMQPVLVGTGSVEASERIAALLEAEGYVRTDYADPDVVREFYAAARDGRPTKRFAVLNAKAHAQEAFVVAEAGVPGAVTIATNMAGRGTDIKLGGNVEVRVARELSELGEGADAAAVTAAVEAEVAANRERVLASGEKASAERGLDRDMPGGLYVIGSERHESRRVDNQLRGRAGRQGDPGRSRFHLSLQDDLVRIFGSGRLEGMLDGTPLGDGEAIVHPWVNRIVAKAQEKVEGHNFERRKDVLKYDDVVNLQRKIVFSQRREFMENPSLADVVAEMRANVVDALVTRHLPPDTYPEQWDLAGLKAALAHNLACDMPVVEWGGMDGIDEKRLRELVHQGAESAYGMWVETNTRAIMDQAERQILLNCIDHVWREHIVAMEHLRESVGLRQMGQRDPLQEFKAEAFEMYNAMVAKLGELVTANVMRVRLTQPAPQAA